MTEAAFAFRQFVIKVHSRCNLACDHCYVYEHADQSWRDRPLVMSDDMMRQTALRIAEHCQIHALPLVHVIFHGGEPLLAGRDRLRRMTRLLRDLTPEGCEVDLRIQTNGVLLDDAFCAQFVADDVKVGVSVDGNRQAHDRHRIFGTGRSSYDAVVTAVRRLGQRSFRSAFGGILCTIDRRNDPIETYEALVALDPPQIEFLLPHATWDQPPARGAPDDPVYADWLIAVYDRWRAQRQPVPIRLFESILRLQAGEGSLTEALGTGAVDLVVIETDGAIEQADSLKIAYDHAPATGFDVERHGFDDVQSHPGFAARSGGMESLCRTCRRCEAVKVCGGGLYAHRYRAESGFRNPSVYCVDLLKLIAYVSRRPPSPTGHPGPIPEVHALSGQDFDELAAGRGDHAIVDLVEAQRSLGRQMLSQAVRSRKASVADSRGWHAVWDALSELDELAPDIVGSVLAHPYVRVWASRTLADPKFSDPSYLWGATLASATRAHTPLAVTLTVGEALPLPTLGVLRFGSPSRRRLTTIVTDTGGAAVTVDGLVVPLADSGRPDPRVGPVWLPLRFIETAGWRVALDDIDPLRGCYDKRPAKRQSVSRLAAWQRNLAAAWDLLDSESPVQALALAAGLRSITPLNTGASRHGSATYRDAAGAVGIAGRSLDSSGVELARLLLHELHHLKMGAVLDMYELFDGSDCSLYEVGWRPDRRPIEAVLQGAYAHMAVAEFWRVLASRSRGGTADRAATECRSLRGQIQKAVDVLAGSSSLTSLGRRWVDGMRSTSHSWPEDMALQG